MNNEELRRQYSIEYQFEAAKRVKESTGFDIVADAKKRREQSSASKQNEVPEFRFRPKEWQAPTLPEPKFKEPAMPDPRSILKQYVTDHPSTDYNSSNNDLVTVVSTSSSYTSALSEDERLTSCIKCKKVLKIHYLVNMVKCPECNAVSPAISLPDSNALSGSEHNMSNASNNDSIHSTNGFSAF